MNYEPVIGLEVHAQLLTESKVFCRCRTAFGGDPNSQVCPICLGLPGVLPVLNKKAVDFAIRMGLATNCTIARRSIFARKNYFYPDLPKGYQISQYEEPLCEHGHVTLELDKDEKEVGIKRIHLEEDAGKSVHAEEYVEQGETLIDLNRCGVALIEIVSEPEICSPKEAYLFLKDLRQIVQYLGICDGNMEEGSFRCDANVSIRPVGSSEFGVKTELKNMNSFRAVEKALAFEIRRQVDVLESAGQILQQTLLWDADNNEAKAMRTKEYADDYRYFPEPDLVPLVVNQDWVEEVKAGLPELPLPRKRRFVSQYGLPEYDAEILTETRALADYFEEVTRHSDDAKSSSNWIMSEVLRVLNHKQIELHELELEPVRLAQLIGLVNSGNISGKIAKSVFQEMIDTGKEAEAIVEDKGLVQLSDEKELQKHVSAVISENPAEVDKYLAGKQQVIGFLVGQVMKKTRGRANPKVVNQLLRKTLQDL